MTMAEWRVIAEMTELQDAACRRVYSAKCKENDIALFYRDGRFFALDAWCSHMGGPLYQGDIEDYKGKCHIMCPWHGYMFDLETGKCEIGIQQNSYSVKIEEGKVLILHSDELSLQQCTSDQKNQQKP